jgi:hypothetical protein
MPAKAPTPRVKSVADIKSLLLQPALTSHFECYFVVPEILPSARQGTAKAFIGQTVPVTSELTSLLSLSCSDATLPGSQLATHNLDNDYTGVGQKHAYRRLYDDRADFTFYVNHNYTQIRFFERWMQYIVGEQQAGSDRLNNFYRMNYPKTYKTTIYITKFERSIGTPQKAPLAAKQNSKQNLTYSFFNAFPTSITSMPVSYESSQLLKCTVSFAYDRYVSENLQGSAQGPTNLGATSAGVPNIGDASNYWNSGANPNASNIDFATAANLNFGNLTNNIAPAQFNYSSDDPTRVFQEYDLNQATQQAYSGNLKLF